MFVYSVIQTVALAVDQIQINVQAALNNYIRILQMNAYPHVQMDFTQMFYQITFVVMFAQHVILHVVAAMDLLI